MTDSPQNPSEWPPPQQPPAGPQHDAGPPIPPGAARSGGVYGAVLRRPFDVAKLVLILAWIVAGLSVLAYIYGLSQGNNFADQFFGQMPTLAQGLFFSGVLHAVAVWLGKQRGSS